AAVVHTRMQRSVTRAHTLVGWRERSTPGVNGDTENVEIRGRQARERVGDPVVNGSGYRGEFSRPGLRVAARLVVVNYGGRHRTASVTFHRRIAGRVIHNAAVVINDQVTATTLTEGLAFRRVQHQKGGVCTGAAGPGCDGPRRNGIGRLSKDRDDERVYRLVDDDLDLRRVALIGGRHGDSCASEPIDEGVSLR